MRREVCVVTDQRKPLLTGSNAVSAVFETIRSDAEFRRVRALTYVDLNANFGGRLDSDGKPRAGDLRNVSLEFSRRQPCRACRGFCDDDLSKRFTILDEQ